MNVYVFALNVLKMVLTKAIEYNFTIKVPIMLPVIVEMPLKR